MAAKVPAKEELSIPDDRVLDFIDGKLRKKTPEEYVRQNIERSLVLEYKYSKSEIKVEFPIKVGSSRRRVDLVIFDEAKAPDQNTAIILCEVKKPGTSPKGKKDGIAQLESYMAACVNARLGVWTNGDDRYCFEKVGSAEKGWTFVEIVDMPAKGQSLEEADRPSRSDLKPAVGDNLLFALRRCHNYIAGNEGLQKPDAFWELLRIIFCKIEDERSTELNFYASSKERSSPTGQSKVKRRLSQVFERSVRGKYPSIFKPAEEIEMRASVVAFVVSQLQGYSLLSSDVDVKGVAYEEVVGSNLRGDRGEFFTPRNAVRMAVSMIGPKPSERVIDPACGTGGFLIFAMNHLLRLIDIEEAGKWADPKQPTTPEFREAERRRREVIERNVVGLDLNPSLVRAAKMNMVMNNDGSGGLVQANSLDNPLRWSDEARHHAELGAFDVVFTNPPFGTKIPIDDPAILEQYELATIWDRRDSGRFAARIGSDGRPILQSSLPPEILFIERCWQFLKPGVGRMAIVLPNGILNNPALAYVRQWIMDHAQILAVVDMHRELFAPSNDTQTSLLFLRRKSDSEMQESASAEPYEIFMAVADRIGHDKRGNPTYRRNPDGSDVVLITEESAIEVVDGAETVRTVETPQLLVDDQTERIATLYGEWLLNQQK